MNDVVINKIQTLQRCIKRAREEYAADPTSFAVNFTRQDAALLNVIRACETAIDLANYVIRTRQLGIPTSSADSFRLLHEEGVLDAPSADRLRKMTAFRNTIVHRYIAVELAIVEAVIQRDLDELLRFTDQIRHYLDSSP